MCWKKNNWNVEDYHNPLQKTKNSFGVIWLEISSSRWSWQNFTKLCKICQWTKDTCNSKTYTLTRTYKLLIICVCICMHKYVLVWMYASVYASLKVVLGNEIFLKLCVIVRNFFLRLSEVFTQLSMLFAQSFRVQKS